MISLSRIICNLALGALLVAALLGPNGMAQVTTASLVGTVSDSTGAILPGAAVTIVNLGTQETRTATANSDGDYAFNLLPIGNYSLRIDAPGFASFSVASVTLNVGDRQRVDAKMQVSASTQQVQVTAAPPALQTDDSTVGTTVGEKAVENLPTNGRNFVDLVQLTPGANPGTANSVGGGTRPDDRRMTSAVSVNGQNTMVNVEQLDGMDNNERIVGTIGVRPSIDAIAEFRVETNLYTAEVGRTAAGVINILTKSGTNQFHGSAYEFLRNDKLDASDFFASTKPEYRQNQYGGSLGGPIVKDKTFFFADFEGLRIVQGETSLSTVPTLFEEQNPGNFSDVGGPVLSPSQLNSIALKYFQLYPAPNRPGTANNYFSAPNRIQNAEVADVRVDHHFDPNNLFFARYTINRTYTYTPGPLPAVDGVQPGGYVYGEDGTANEQQQNIQLNYVHIFTPNVILELKTGYTRINNASLPLNYGSNDSQAFGMPGVNYSMETSALAPFLPSGYASVGDGEYVPLQDLDNTFQYNGALTWNKGNQSIKMGAALIRRQATNVQSALPVGQFTFTGQYAQEQFYGNTTTSCLTCGLVGMLEGYADQVQRSNQLYPISYRTWEPSVFFQDDWHARPWLTLNLGVRYDVFTQFTEAHNRLSNFDPTTGTLIVAGVNGVSGTAGVPNDYSNLAPRVGFAASLPHQTVLRGGFGMSFFPDNYGTTGDRQNQPFVTTFGPNYNYNISNGLPIPGLSSVTDPQGSIGSAMALNFRNAYMYQTSLTLEKQIGANVASLTYVGDTGRHLAQFIPNIDVPAPQGVVNYTTNPTALQMARPYYTSLPGISSITDVYSRGVSSYNALEAVLQRHYTNGLTFNANYTFAHMLDNTGDLNQDNQAGLGLLPNQASTYDYGNSDADIRHRFTASANYELPFGKGSHGVEKAVIGDWQVNGIFVWQTGLPFTVQNNNPQINTGVTNDRPNMVGNPNVSDPNISEFFNTAAFTPQTFGTAGDEQRNPLHGPHLRYFNFSAAKEIPIRENLRLQLRSEFFNITNTPSFSVPNAAMGTQGFGTISSTSQFYTPREIQFAAKLTF
jgi:hypothetical protein